MTRFGPANLQEMKVDALAIDAFKSFLADMNAWESAITDRLKRATLIGEEGWEAEMIMKEYETLLRVHCTEGVFKDEARRRINLHYHVPSEYGLSVIEDVFGGTDWTIIRCFDKRDRELGVETRYEFRLKIVSGAWRIDQMIYLPSDGTEPFLVGI